MVFEWKINIFMPVDAVFFQVEIAADLFIELFIAEFNVAAIFGTDRIAIFIGIVKQVIYPAGNLPALRRIHDITAGWRHGEAGYSFTPIAKYQFVLLIQFEQGEGQGSIQHAAALNVVLRDYTSILYQKIRIG